MAEPGIRSSAAQLKAMTRMWPDFRGQRRGDGTLVWHGPLRPKAQPYKVCIIWQPAAMSLPYVMIVDPPIKPRDGAEFAEIPHLIFNAADPVKSGLCLFDPAGGEWSPHLLVAETTVFWAAEWLTYYELWHLTGKWLGPSVGYESVAHIMRAEAELIREVQADVH